VRNGFSPGLIVLLAVVLHAAPAFHVDSVTVDSVWNNDTTIFQQATPRRDVKLSFVPVATDSVRCFVDVWMIDDNDSLYKWMYSRDLLSGTAGESFYKVLPNRKITRTMVLTSGNRDSVRFRVTVRSDTMSLNRLRLGTGISGWTDSTASYAHFATAQELQSIIDGGYGSFFSNGMIEGYRHWASDAAGHSAQCTINDFGTKERAAAMYAKVKSIWFSSVPIASYGDSVALGHNFLGGMSTACHFNQYFAQVDLSGYPAEDSLIVRADAKKFVDLYKQRSQLP
jgi:hypothetical protein